MRSLRKSFCAAAASRRTATNAVVAIRHYTTSNAVTREFVLEQWGMGEGAGSVKEQGRDGDGEGGETSAASAKRSSSSTMSQIYKNIASAVSSSSSTFSSSSSSRQEAAEQENSPQVVSAQDINWVDFERLDYLVSWQVPSSWKVVERVRENFLNVQAIPPPSSPRSSKTTQQNSNNTIKTEEQSFPKFHGFNISCFAYNARVKEADEALLLERFLHRFGASIKAQPRIVLRSPDLLASGIVVAGGHSKQGQQQGGDVDISSICDPQDVSKREVKLCSQVARHHTTLGAIAIVEFSPSLPPHLQHQQSAMVARGMCRAFFSPNRRYHYVSMFAVPKAEYDISFWPLRHATMSIQPISMQRATDE